MRTEPPLRTFLRTFVSTNGRRRPSYAPFFYFGVLFIAREGKCGAKRREKFDCWACQHQFLVNNNHSKARCTQELLLLRLKSLLLLCVLAGWFLQERKEREANEQQQREAPRKIPRCVSCVTSISGRTTSKQSTTSAKRNMTSCLDRMTSSKQSTTSSKPSTTSLDRLTAAARRSGGAGQTHLSSRDNRRRKVSTGHDLTGKRRRRPKSEAGAWRHLFSHVGARREPRA